jgi:hypothetical protein
MKAYGEVDVQIHIFLASALVGSEWSASRPGRFSPGERAPGPQWIGGWMGPRAGVDDVDKRKFLTIPGLELRPLVRPTCSQSLCQLRYPFSHGYRHFFPMALQPFLGPLPHIWVSKSILHRR